VLKTFKKGISMSFKRHRPTGSAATWYKTNGGKYGHDFREVIIGPNCIFLNDGYKILKTIYYRPKTKIRELKLIASELLNKGVSYEYPIKSE
jgi:hypothetical protein